MPAAAAAEPAVEEWIAVRVKHGSAVHSLRLAHEDLVEDLKAAIFSLTDIPPERQKILGLSRGRLPPDSSRISQLAPPPSSWKGRSELGERILALQVIGTPLVDTFKDPAALLGLEVSSILQRCLCGCAHMPAGRARDGGSVRGRRLPGPSGGGQGAEDASPVSVDALFARPRSHSSSFSQT
jgi:hypothetical protein